MKMNQIPSEGVHCDSCPCFALYMEVSIRRICLLYKQNINQHFERLPICLKDRPKIVKGGKHETED